MITTPTYTINGVKGENMSLPKELFGQNISRSLLAQSVRVYLSNQRESPAKTKTRSDVAKTTAKMYKQKGTGRARHGSYSAPIFVGGGVSLGPDGRQNFERKMSKPMIKKALVCALSQKNKDKEVVVLTGASKIKGKTSEIRNLIDAVGKKGVLVIIATDQHTVRRSFSNVAAVSNCVPSRQLNTYMVLRSKMLIVTSEAVEELQKYVS